VGIEISMLHVRRSAFIKATPARVWGEFASRERLAVWFGRGREVEVYEPELGGQALLSVESGAELQSYEQGWHSRHLDALKAIAEG
jgi:hypothetical protein